MFSTSKNKRNCPNELYLKVSESSFLTPPLLFFHIFLKLFLHFVLFKQKAISELGELESIVECLSVSPIKIRNNKASSSGEVKLAKTQNTLQLIVGTQ